MNLRRGQTGASVSYVTHASAGIRRRSILAISDRGSSSYECASLEGSASSARSGNGPVLVDAGEGLGDGLSSLVLRRGVVAADLLVVLLVRHGA